MLVYDSLSNWLRSQRLAKLTPELEYIEEVQKAEVKFRSEKRQY
jgi:hypothetical protein